MAVVNNTLSEIGDSIIIPAGIPITGISSISGFTEVVSGVTATRTFNREFRYSLDGINWTIWIGLSPLNLGAIPIDPTYDFFIEYRYTRSGTDTTGVLVFESVNLDAVYVEKDCGPGFHGSVFSYFFNCCCNEESLRWCVNVLEKLYLPGILPQAMTRGENQNANNEDRDFIDFWRTVTCFFGLIVAYARKFETFSTNKELLQRYLLNRGIFVCQDSSLADMRYVMENFYREMAHRGTAMISVKKGEDVNGTPKPVDGELLRLICFDPVCDEFLFSISEFDSSGWVVNSWSPLYKGVEHQQQLTKIYEASEDFVNLSEYPLINPGNCSIITDGSRDVLRISAVPIGQKAGIGFTAPDFDKATIVSKKVPYELSFYVRRVGVAAPLSVRMYGYDLSNIPKDLREVKSSALMPISNDCLVQETIVAGTDYYFVRVILYPETHVYNADPNITTPSIGVGNNLKMTGFVCKIIPEIVVDNIGGGAVSGDLYIWNMKFAPLKTDHGMTFVDAGNIIQTWIKNNNGTYGEGELNEIIKYYLLPYSAGLKNNFI